MMVVVVVAWDDVTVILVETKVRKVFLETGHPLSFWLVEEEDETVSSSFKSLSCLILSYHLLRNQTENKRLFPSTSFPPLLLLFSQSLGCLLIPVVVVVVVEYGCLEYTPPTSLS